MCTPVRIYQAVQIHTHQADQLVVVMVSVFPMLYFLLFNTLMSTWCCFVLLFHDLLLTTYHPRSSVVYLLLNLLSINLMLFYVECIPYALLLIFQCSVVTLVLFLAVVSVLLCTVAYLLVLHCVLSCFSFNQHAIFFLVVVL